MSRHTPKDSNFNDICCVYIYIYMSPISSICSSVMASSVNLPLVLVLLFLFINAALGGIVCDDLPVEICAFSIASSGHRCLVETTETNDENLGLQCRTSEVVVEKMAGHIETDECVEACRLDRNSVGISSDALLEPQFAKNICSQFCYRNCPNVIDLFFNLAAGEGVFLPDLCNQQRSNPRRAMGEFLSSGAAASAPTTARPWHFFSSSAPAPL